MTEEIFQFCEKEHKHIRDLFENYLRHKNDTRREMFAHFRKLKCALHRHMEVEEDVFFRFCEDKTGLTHIGPTFLMRQEHGLIRDLLWDLQEKLLEGNPDTTMEERKLISFFQLHGAKEDQILRNVVDFIESPEEEKELLESLSHFPDGCCKKCATLTVEKEPTV